MKNLVAEGNGVAPLCVWTFVFVFYIELSGTKEYVLVYSVIITLILQMHHRHKYKELYASYMHYMDI